MIDFSFSNSKTPTQGALLLSDPFAGDSYFTRSVVLLCDHNDEGSFGFVLNNYLEVDLHTLHPSFPEINSRIGIGGPVDTQSIFYIHSFGDQIENSIKINENLYFGGDFNQLIALLQKDESLNAQVRFFLGYAGWSINQLNEEIKENAWIVTNAYSNNEVLSTQHFDLWKELMQKQGAKFKLMSEFPLNPNNN